MRRAGREAQPLGAARNGRVIDRLDVHAVFGEQHVADLLGLDRIADHQRHDVRGRIHHRQPGLGEHRLEHRCGSLLPVALDARRLEVAHRRQRARDQHRRQRGREDEPRRVRADHVDDRLVGADIAAHHADRLAERAFDDRQPLGHTVALGNAAAARAVHADGMDFVEIGQRIVAVGEIANLGDRRDVAVHRIDALERDQLGHRRVGAAEQFLEMRDIIVAKDVLLAPRIADPRNHRGVVEFVREDHAARQHLGERRQRRLVRDIARREQQGAFLAVQIGQLGLEIDMVMRVAADIARAARAGADIVQRAFHRRDHIGVLAHREIIVRAPHGDRLGAVMPGKAARVGKGALVAQDVDEHAVAPLDMQAIDRLREDSGVIDSARRCVHVHRRDLALEGAQFQRV